MNEVLSYTHTSAVTSFFRLKPGQTEFTVQLPPGLVIASCPSKGVLRSQCSERVAIQTLPRQASSLVDVWHYRSAFFALQAYLHTHTLTD